MPARKALLMEIHYPDGSDSLYLMTGQGFELLHEDKSGREVYGLRHNDRDYLFFPFSFKPVDAGVLSMHLPPEYEESCLDHRADGARIVFGSVHGVPFFPEMPDEYKTNTGVISRDASGFMRILLDKAEHGHSPFGQADCGCGHEHHAGPEHHAGSERHAGPGLHAGESGSHTGCGCGHGQEHAHRHQDAEKIPSASSHGRGADDAELAENIRRAAEAFNEALRQGFEAGLSLKLSVSPSGKDREADDCPQVKIPRIARPL